MGEALAIAKMTEKQWEEKWEFVLGDYHHQDYDQGDNDGLQDDDDGLDGHDDHDDHVRVCSQ